MEKEGKEREKKHWRGKRLFYGNLKGRERGKGRKNGLSKGNKVEDEEKGEVEKKKGRAEKEKERTWDRYKRKMEGT